MSSDNPPTKPASTEEENQTGVGTNRKTGPTRPSEQPLKCPRCDSPNTKFCYYNNYSLTQPRHFCKTCRRYWTKGGALRNVPIGGGCRKNKKMRSSSSSSRLTSADLISPPSAEMDFQLGGGLPFPFANTYNQFGSFGGNLELSGSPSSLMGFTTYPLSIASVNPSVASSIESLSSINQEIHWKLQQQRLGVIFGSTEKEKSQPVLFQNLQGSKPETANPRNDNEIATREWFFGNSYAPNPNSASNGNGNDDATNWTSGVQAWNDLNQYNTLP